MLPADALQHAPCEVRAHAARCAAACPFSARAESSYACARVAQGIIALQLSWDETLLAVHHAGGVDVHHVTHFMSGNTRPLRTHCAGNSPHQFEWRVRLRSLPQLFNSALTPHNHRTGGRAARAPSLRSRMTAY